MRDAAGVRRASIAGVSIEVDARLPAPVSEQLRVQIITAVQRGDLVAGTRLPAVRRLAEELSLAANTVAKVYRELERDEFVTTEGRNGTSIAPQGTGPARQAQLAAAAYASRARELGLSEQDALAIVAAALSAP
ncbi:GntR family transcriptional regulator [Subtercola frigoramans]|uniref:DNA-binding transcriptional regulator YhcF (GntR family) n=1 Tax=Subtercola frigoramans TaxID=120298 RepID=A0ABS2L0B9_9MICO|nr:GntR family transcriptional regulator [Subtercola frigoramans]MBM7470494.1 DNA-binding transcriptional regulator YhcF (GntR family) [Subtercola frigoramans]